MFVCGAFGERRLIYPNVITCAAGTLSTPNYSFQTGTKGDLTIEQAVLDVNAGEQDERRTGRRGSRARRGLLQRAS